MKVLKLALAASAIGMAGISAAHAADAVQEPPPVQDYAPQDYAAMGFYLRGDVGASFLDWSGGKSDTSLAVGGGVGYRFNPNMRTDLRVDWAGDYNVGGGDNLGVTTVLGNMYFDWANSSIFTPYLGAGIGYGWADFSKSKNDDGFAYALMAGVSTNLSQNVALDFGYRFRDVMIKGADPYENQVLLGIRFGF